MKNTLTIIVLLTSFNSFALSKAIYGEDSREEAYLSSNPLHREVSLSVAARISRGAILTQTETETHLRNATLSDIGICENEQFAEQHAVSACTGFLVGSKYLVTAGHCVINGCGSEMWAFDYALNDKDQKLVTLQNKNIYYCKQVVSHALSAFPLKKDYALIELDREVTDRKPLRLSTKKPKKGTSLFVVGTPTGLPLKVATGSVKSKGIIATYFRTNLDTFAGNSGSPVFNEESGKVEGILVRGQEDYERSMGCLASTVYGENEGGEHVTYIKNIKIPKTKR